MKKKTSFNPLLLVFAAVVLICCVLLGILLAGSRNRASLRSPEAIPTETCKPVVRWGDEVDRGGVHWTLNRNLHTLLFMGINNHEPSKSPYSIQGNADTILLLVMDDSEKTIQIIEISRDTMVDVDIYDKDRNYLYSDVMQLTLQYTAADSPARACQLMKRKVSQLLNDTKIHETCSVTMDGITAAADALGGIRLTLEDDWTDINPNYIKGAEILLDGPTAERFIRYRDISTLDSNNTRMDRHSWLIKTMVQQILADSDSTESVWAALQPFMEYDFSDSTLRKLKEYHLKDTFLRLPGTVVHGDNLAEYQLDYPALEQMILEQFYLPD